MGSSNRHWPSLFKSKPCNHHEFTSPHFSSSPSFKSIPNFPSPGGADGSSMEERTPEPKPRWNPKPEQIRILEAIFNSGMVNPPREEIKKIRAQLQEYGQVGDANVFYWFQNRKSRSKQKNRQLLHKPTATTNTITPQTPPLAPVAPSSSSSSSSDRSSPNKFTNSSSGSVLESPTGHHGGYGFYQQHQPNDAFLQQELAISPPSGALPFFFPVPQAAGSFGAGSLCFNEITHTPVTSVGGGGGDGGGMFPSLSSVADQGAMGTFSGLLLGDMTGATRRSMFDDQEEEDKMRYEAEELSFMVTNPTNTNAIHIPPTSASPLVLPSLSQFQGAGEPGGGGRMVVGPAKSTVFINDVSFEVPAVGPFNLREVFGEDVVLLHQSGHPVPTNEWGLTLHPLQHGAFYFLVRTLASKHHPSTAPPHELFQASQFPFQL